MDQAFYDIAVGFSDMFGESGPFHDVTLSWPGAITEDSGGDVSSAASDVSKTAKAQISAADERLRQEDGYMEKDMLIYVLAASFTGQLDVRARIIFATGPHAGTYQIQSAQKDTAGIGWRCRGRPLP